MMSAGYYVTVLLLLLQVHAGFSRTLDAAWKPRRRLLNQEVCPPPDVENISLQVDAEYPIGRQMDFICQPGYRGDGNPRHQCTPNGWEQLNAQQSRPFSCRVVHCPPPPDRDNGFYVGQRHTFGGVLNISCMAGYKLVGLSSANAILCMPNGRWTVSSSKCERVTCEEPPTPLHGSKRFYSGRQNDYESQYEFSCDRNYKIKGQRHGQAVRRECLQNETWSGTDVVCEEVACPEPKPLINGEIIGDDNDYGARRVFSCRENYVFDPSDANSDTYCTRDGTWSDATPRCVPAVRCDPLERPSNGNMDRVAGYEFYQNSEYEFSCRRGYKLSSKSPGETLRRKCSRHGWWSGRTARCVQINCPRLTSPEHGWVAANSAVSVGTTIDTGCTEGYRIKNVPDGQTRVSRTCEENEQWSGDEVVCEVIVDYCPPLMVPEHGSTDGAGRRSINTRRTINCDLGYKVKGGLNSERTVSTRCQENRKWSREDAKCVEIECSTLQEPQNGQLRNLRGSGSSVNSAYEVTCDETFLLRNGEQSMILTCGSDGSWNEETPQCHKKGSSCPRPAPTNAVVFFHQTDLSSLPPIFVPVFPIGTSVTCICLKPGEMYIPSTQTFMKEIFCTHTGWDLECSCQGNEYPKLRLRDTDTELLPNGYLRFQPGYYLYLECEVSPESWDISWDDSVDLYEYTPYWSGRKSIKGYWDDSQNGRFNGNYRCRHLGRTAFLYLTTDERQSSTCPDPGNPENGLLVKEQGDLVNQRYSEGSIVRFTCNDGGTVLGGSERSYCWKDGTWSQEKPFCAFCRGPPGDKCNSPRTSKQPTHTDDSGTNSYSNGTVAIGKCVGEDVLGSWQCIEKGWEPIVLCEALPDGIDASCRSVSQERFVTIPKFVFGNAPTNVEYYKNGTVVTPDCRKKNKADVWLCGNQGTWEQHTLCEALPDGVNAGCRLDTQESFVTIPKFVLGSAPINVEYYKTGTVVSSNCRNTGEPDAWLCGNQGTWEQYTLCEALPGGINASCRLDSQESFVTIPKFVSGDVITNVDYYKDGTVVSSNCRNTDAPDAWLCGNQGTWEQYTLCEALPDGVDAHCRLDTQESFLTIPKVALGSAPTNVEYYKTGTVVSSNCRNTDEADSTWFCGNQGIWQQQDSRVTEPDVPEEQYYYNYEN